MESFQHVEVEGWRDELEQLRQELRASILPGDPSDVEDELQTSLESLAAPDGHPKHYLQKIY
jgi:hypothetical protein